MKFQTFATIEQVNNFLENRSIKIIDFRRTLMIEPAAYGDNIWEETAIFYEEEKEPYIPDGSGD